MESRLLGFPCFPYSVIPMACFRNECRKITITAKARFRNGNCLSEPRSMRALATIHSFVQSDLIPRDRYIIGVQVLTLLRRMRIVRRNVGI